MINLQVDIDDNVVSYLTEMMNGMDDAIEFAGNEVRRFLKYQAYPTVAAVLSSRAGPGFPVSYRNQLIEKMYEIPIYTTMQGGIFVLEASLEVLGGYDEFTKGFHVNAMIDTGDYQGTSVDDFKSYRITTKPDIVKHSGPWQGGSSDDGLLNSAGSSANWHGDRERRREWWVEAVIHRNTLTEVWASWPKRNIKWAVPESEVMTFEQVASARCNAWAPYAPQWVLLEYGYRENEPIVNPVGFTDALRRVTACAGRTIMIGAIQAFKELVEAKHERGRVALARGSRGGRGFAQPIQYTPSGPRFTSYKQQLQAAVPNADYCLSLI